MRIVELETLRVQAFPNLIFVLLRTDDGAEGLGETFYGAEAVETHLHSIVAPALLGQDARAIERHARALAGYVGYAGTGVENRARSAVDVALWDLLGQSCGEPVYNLLGGLTTEQVPIYNTCAGPGYVNAATGQSVANWGMATGHHEDLDAAIHHPGKLARDLLNQGITGMKIWPFDTYAEASGGHRLSSADLGSALRPVAAIRDAVGEQMDIMIELHGLWDVPTARRIVRALEPYSPAWVEDPVRSDITDGLARVAEATSSRVAAGETVQGGAAFQRLLSQGALGVVTVDVTWSGGLTHARKIASLAETYGVPVAPHDCTGPVALTACTHLSTAVPNAFVQETVRAAYDGWYASLVTGGPVIRDGTVRAPQDPGLGVRLRPGLRQEAGTTTRVSR